LQKQFGERVQQDFAVLTDSRYERHDLQDWDFGELPGYVEVVRAGVRLRAYPALVVDGQGRIDLHLFDQQSAADAAHREGLLALFRKRCAGLVRDIRRAAPDFDKQVLWFSTVAPAGVLQADLERAVLQAAFLQEGDAIRDGQSFNRRLEAGRARLLTEAVEIGGYARQALEAFQALKRETKGRVAPALLAVSREVQAQAGELVYAGFLSATPRDRLPHLRRYLEAAQRRLQQAGANLTRDREQALLVARYREQYLQAVGRGMSSAALSGFRWLIEELRVSLFAQSLGTAEKVSPQRLDRLWREINS
jgi:ATP-dependent helicase HrpA